MSQDPTPKPEEQQPTAEELEQAYDDGWDEATGKQAPEAGESGEEPDPDPPGDTKKPGGEEPGDGDDPDTAGKAAGDEPGEEDDEAKRKAQEREEQRRKSWEGRQRAEEQRLKAEKEKLEADRKALDERKAKIAEALENGDADTDWDEVAKELEMPELAKLGNEMKRHRELLAEQHAVREEERQLADREAEAAQEHSQAEAQERHFNAITEKHSDAFDVVRTEAFTDWMDNLPFKQGAEYQRVMKEGTADEVVAMLDEFKEGGKGKAKKPDPGDLASPRTGAARRKVGKPDPNDYDAGWEEATRS